jgi:hypothetical protein
LKVARNFDRLPKRKDVVADDELIEIAKSDGLIHAALVQKSSVTTAQIDHPKFPYILGIDNGVPSRNLWRIE